MSQTFTKEQQLLVDEIISKGYNQDDFEDFVLHKEPNKGQDLTQWTYEELLKIIQLYQQEKKEQQSDSYQIVELDSPDISDQIQIIDRDTFVQKQTLESIKITDKIALIPFEKTVTCKQMYFFIDENIELQFDISPPIQEGGGILDFFSKTIVFPIQILPMEWKVRRTLQDFIQLRNILSAAFPEYIIPSFPYNDINDYDIIMKEQQNIVKVLNVFLQIYNKKPIIRTVLSSLLFLNEENSKQFQQKFYKEQVLQKQYNLSQKQSKTGTLTFSFNQNQYQKYKDYQVYLNGEQGNYEIIQKYLEQFAEFTYKGQQSLGYSIEMIQSLCNSLPQYTEAQEFGKALCMIKSYFQTQKDFVLRSTKQIMDVLLITLVKFKNSRQQLTELKTNLFETFQNFSNEFNLLEKRKEDLFVIKDLQKWGLNQEQQLKVDINKCFNDLKYAKEIMLPKDTFYVDEKRDQYVYMLNKFNEQYEQQFIIETDKLLNEIQYYLDNMRCYTNNQLQNWDFLIQEYEEYKISYQKQICVK
ncbi:unnamed protein product [Paramecium octaurelia]|uniref:PX domain-containing protein n=1 Tax=Paramecium octaurelia TaxID=43137 RepID=A0A8S1W7Q2_PAROT|nr:unnamed protein product [Paramecium octaurelia]